MWIKTNELKGAALDWAAAQVSGAELDIIDMPSGPYIGLKGRSPDGFPTQYSPSANWSQGGPLIENMGITIEYALVGMGKWHAYQRNDEDHTGFYAERPLTAAMRAIVASELGDEVDVPEELL